MAKKIVTLFALLALVATFAVAQEATTTAAPVSTTTTVAKPAGPAKPAVSVDFLQRMYVETTGTQVANNAIDTTDALTSRTEIQAKVAFDLGSGLKIAPWIKDRLEIKLNPENLTKTATVTGAVLDTAQETLGAIRFRNRFYAGLDTTLGIDKAFNVGLNLELRIANDLRTDKAYAGADAAIERRFSPILTVDGKIGDLGYKLSQMISFYFDKIPEDDSQDNSYTGLEGTYNVNYTLKLDPSVSLRLDLNQYLEIVNPSVHNTLQTSNIGTPTAVVTENPYLAQVISTFTPTVTAVLGDFNPYVGLFWSTDVNGGNDKQRKLGTFTAGLSTGNIGDKTVSNLIGGLVGADFKVGLGSLNVNYVFAADQAGGNASTLQSQLIVGFKVKG